jgi:glutamyl-tRNA synthetase
MKQLVKWTIWTYRQSERKDIYAAYAKELIDNGWAYYAFDTEALEQARNIQEEKGNTFIYNHTIRETLDTSLVLTEDETAARIARTTYVIRFKTPVNETLHLQDIIRGEVKFEIVYWR